tara:strand:- start:277 stop:423 length:147 start_codon:yes stop_codon:yes gene_type:complete
MTRKSINLSEEAWKSLEQLAANKEAYWSGKPSWRKLVRLLANGDIKLK